MTIFGFLNRTMISTSVFLIVVISMMNLEIQIERQYFNSKQNTEDQTFEKIASIYSISVTLNIPSFSGKLIIFKKFMKKKSATFLFLDMKSMTMEFWNNE